MTTIIASVICLVVGLAVGGFGAAVVTALGLRGQVADAYETADQAEQAAKLVRAELAEARADAMEKRDYVTELIAEELDLAQAARDRYRRQRDEARARLAEIIDRAHEQALAEQAAADQILADWPTKTIAATERDAEPALMAWPAGGIGDGPRVLLGPPEVPHRRPVDIRIPAWAQGTTRPEGRDA